MSTHLICDFKPFQQGDKLLFDVGLLWERKWKKRHNVKLGDRCSYQCVCMCVGGGEHDSLGKTDRRQSPRTFHAWWVKTAAVNGCSITSAKEKCASCYYTGICESGPVTEVIQVDASQHEMRFLNNRKGLIILFKKWSEKGRRNIYWTWVWSFSWNVRHLSDSAVQNSIKFLRAWHLWARRDYPSKSQRIFKCTSYFYLKN